VIERECGHAVSVGNATVLKQSSTDRYLLPAEDLRLLRGAVFFAAAFLLVDFFAAGTLPPARRASESPIAIACLRLVTFLPELPLFNVPALSSSIAFSTFSDAFLPYLPAIVTLLSLEEKDAIGPSARRVTGEGHI
jgi:hypothetical protein